MNSQRSPAPRGDIEHPGARGINPQIMKMKMNKLWRMNILRLRQVHRPSRCGRKRWHHQSHHHKRCNHQGLHLWDRMMHLKNKGLFSSQILSAGLTNLNPRQEVKLVIIYIYFLALHELFPL
jgi:hypothetical protein